MEQRIKYKVVNERRGSCVVRPQFRKFYKKYHQDTVVEMTLGTFGLMVFSSPRLAKKFKRNQGPRDGSWMILKVRPLEKSMKKPPAIFYADRLNFAYKIFKKSKKVSSQISPMYIPEGTLFYRAVKVLD